MKGERTLKDNSGEYIGTLEVTQNIKPIKEILLDEGDINVI